MQSIQGYPIDYLLEFLDPAFPKKMAWDHGWGQLIEFQTRMIDPQETQRALISYLEEWINSGFQPDGSERPYDRNFAPKSSREVWDFEDGKPNLLPAPAAVGAMANLFNGTPMVRDQHYLIHRSIEAHRTGSVSILIDSRGGIHFEPTREIGRETADTLAAGLFLQFYRSEIIFRLMQCRHCHSFAVRLKPRESYVRGWHCPKCIKKVPALVSSGKSREDKRKRWFGHAVQSYIKLSAFQKLPEREVLVLRIRDEVNSQLKLADQIKRNTISINLKKIRETAIKNKLQAGRVQ